MILFHQLTTGDEPLEGDTVVCVANFDRFETRLQQFESILDDRERRRAEQYRLPRVRQQFILSRGILRRILATKLHLTPGEVVLTYEAGGKPILDPEAHSTPLRFNLSHTDGLMVFAFTHDRRIGVDVERIRPIPNASALVERFFSPREQHDFQKLPETLQLEAFFNAWTRKEAVLKGTGDGVNYVDRCEVTLLPGEPPCLLALHDDPDAGQNWTLTSWIPESGFIAALAIETKPI